MFYSGALYANSRQVIISAAFPSFGEPPRPPCIDGIHLSRNRKEDIGQWTLPPGRDLLPEGLDTRATGCTKKCRLALAQIAECLGDSVPVVIYREARRPESNLRPVSEQTRTDADGGSHASLESVSRYVAVSTLLRSRSSTRFRFAIGLSSSLRAFCRPSRYRTTRVSGFARENRAVAYWTLRTRSSWELAKAVQITSHCCNRLVQRLYHQSLLSSMIINITI